MRLSGDQGNLKVMYTALVMHGRVLFSLGDFTNLGWIQRRKWEGLNLELG